MEEYGAVRMVPRICGVMGELRRVRNQWRTEMEEDIQSVWRL